jgi:hypothetical protein
MCTVVKIKNKNFGNGTHRIQLYGNSKYTLLANGGATTHIKELELFGYRCNQLPLIEKLPQ